MDWEEVRLQVPLKNEGVGGDAGVAIRGDGVVNKVDGAKGWDSNLGSARKFLGKMGAIFAENLGGDRFWGKD